ncbi:alpha/beta fold hydrolase [Streptomyces sp. NPDC047315]|uniref:alpha/beta fold hydrolase n=1 Tax=Streptomyces sp. NPDC047315 TaxID=3155142 RepID=UPI0033D24400
MKVPVDWAKPKGATTEVHLVRHRATDPKKRIGALLVNPGGPGASGVESVMYSGTVFGTYSPKLLKRFDLIGFDPRGIDRSNRVQCDEAIADKMPKRPRNAAEFEKLRTLNAKLAKSCLKKGGALAAHMEGESVARDMDAIRAALGERKISFLGHSYGTVLGERYARLFPERLRALALDSAVDTVRPTAERLLTDGAVTLNDIAKKLAAWCETDASCALKGQDVTAVIDELYARADAGTLRVPGPDGPTRTEVSSDQFAAFLTRVLSDYAPEGTAQELAALQSGKGEVYFPTDYHDPVKQLVLCRDNDFRIRDYAEYRAISERVAKAAPHVRHDAQALDFVLGCQGWPMAPKPQPTQAKGALPPVFVVNATHDPATPLPGARRTAGAFPKASLLTVDTVSHVLYGDLATRPAIENYLIDPKG